MPIGVSQMEVPLSPGAILRWGRGATSREHGLIERIDIVNAKDCAAPPGREIARREAQIDEGSPSLEGTEARLWPAIDQREAELTIERKGLGHGPYSEGHGTDVVNHRHSVCSYERLLLSGLHAWPDLGGHGLHMLQHLLKRTAHPRQIHHEVSHPQDFVLPDVQGDLGRSADKWVAVV
jgi:hypothetical protein